MNKLLVENASLSEKIAANRARRIETAPQSFRRLLKQAMSGKCSPRMAIKAQCAECNGFDRQAISDCTAYACPLWHFRPYRNPTEILVSNACEEVSTKEGV